MAKSVSSSGDSECEGSEDGKIRDLLGIKALCCGQRMLSQGRKIRDKAGEVHGTWVGQDCVGHGRNWGFP